MQLAITHGDQQRLDEEEQVPRRNGETVDKIEAEDPRVDYPAPISGAARNEPTEANQHRHKKASARGAVEPTISLHFAPETRFALGPTLLENSQENTTQRTYRRPASRLSSPGLGPQRLTGIAEATAE